jgi:Fic family protein
MFIETRKAGKKRKYYLAYAFREEGRVRKIRRYMGEDLSEEQIAKLKEQAAALLLERIKIYRSTKDPFKGMLSKKDIKELKDIAAEEEIKIIHLSEEEWVRFSELFSYDTNAIEGSTIRENEAKDIIEKDKWPKYAEKWEISETYGVVDAIKYLREASPHISLELIKELHKIVFKNSKSFAGKFRSRGIEVVIRDKTGNITHRGAPSNQVTSLLTQLIRWYKKYKNKLPPLALAAVVHNQFENIHPFQDGNGRVGRLLLNNILIKNNLPPVNIELKNRKQYYKALQEYQNKGDIRPTIRLILKEYRNLKNKLDR